MDTEEFSLTEQAGEFDQLTHDMTTTKNSLIEQVVGAVTNGHSGNLLVQARSGEQGGANAIRQRL